MSETVLTGDHGTTIRERPGRVRWRRKTVIVDHDPFCYPQKSAQLVKVLEQEWLIEEYMVAIPPHSGGGWGPARSEWREVPTEADE